MTDWAAGDTLEVQFRLPDDISEVRLEVQFRQFREAEPKSPIPRHFADVLARIALAIARRESKR